MKSRKKLLEFIDEYIYSFLKDSINIMPLRFVKLIAMYYSDARIRKMYFRKLGVYMGDNTYANLGMKIIMEGEKENDMVYIGNNVSIGPNLLLIASSSPNNSKELKEISYVREKLLKNQKITIDDEVWIGANVTILPGVHVGKCSIIGAGSVVISNIEPYSIYAGVPAKKIREIGTMSRKSTN
ncbi:hypothetical protein psyc5s11_31600 [Clostridium gelidum]|uniref:Galactoside O-acetyltransferase n=1 Tax=Clostridium gelidum TaxID=704125 RepID=A0ABM7T6W5_9CLOT|nr:acyltransferase [Clostridium gelidum]BCZ47093.1 hypothetical protein psyc5s11_31600 [Clostridium gelidum]